MIGVPFFEDAMGDARQRLTKILGSHCEIRIHISVDPLLALTIEDIDHASFRSDLWFTADQIAEHAHQPGSVLFIAIVDERPVALLYGYNKASDRETFYLCSVASLIEGRGIDSIMVGLLLIYCFDVGYSSVRLYTEEVDDKGRHLREFYEHLGFICDYISLDEGMVMHHQLEPNKLEEIYSKYIDPNSPIEGMPRTLMG